MVTNVGIPCFFADGLEEPLDRAGVEHCAAPTPIVVSKPGGVDLIQSMVTRGLSPMATTLQKQVLIDARVLIADPASWTMWMLASTEKGRPVAWHDRSARRWCAVGAIHRAAFDLVGNKAQAVSIANEVISTIYPHTSVQRNLPAVNDSQGHAAVIELLDRALAADRVGNTRTTQ